MQVCECSKPVCIHGGSALSLKEYRVFVFQRSVKEER